MEAVYPQALFSTAGMIALLGVVVPMEVLSLGFLWIVSYEVRQMRNKHAIFFQAMSDDDHQHERVMDMSYVMYWIYVISTFFVTLLTLFMFVFQPHIL